MNEKTSSVNSKAEPKEETAIGKEETTEAQPDKAPAPTFAESVNSRTRQDNPIESEDETDRKQDKSIALLAEQTRWIAKQTKWIRYQVIAATFLGAVTLGVLVYHGIIMRRQSHAMINQTGIMKGQLDAMNSGSSQTQQMIAATQRHADAAAAQAGTSQALAEQNKDLVSASLAQAEATRKGAEIAQQSFYIGDRPYINARDVTIETFEAGIIPSITIYFENTGKTPALDLQTGVIADVAKLPEPDLKKYSRMTLAELKAIDVKNSPYAFAMPYGSKVFLPAGASIYAETRGPELSPTLVENIKSENMFLLVWGGSMYKDGLGRFHRMTFCFFYDPKGDLFVACPSFNVSQ